VNFQEFWADIAMRSCFLRFAPASRYNHARIDIKTMPNRHFLPKLLIIFSLITVLSGCSMLPSNQTGNVLVAESFDENPGVMQTYSRDTGNAEVDGGEFAIRTFEQNYLQWALVKLNFTDAVIEVSAHKVAGPDDNIYGVICRYQDDLNFYFLAVSSDGYYGIGRMLNGERMLLGSDQLQPTSVVKGGTSANDLRVTCSNTTLILEVNGQTLEMVNDQSFSEGQAGLFAGEFTDTGLEIRFDNLLITRA